MAKATQNFVSHRSFSKECHNTSCSFLKHSTMDAEVAKLQATIARDQQLIQAASKTHYTFMKGPGARLSSVIIPIGLAAVSTAGLVRGVA